MNNHITRKADTGEAGNRGQFGTHTRDADTVELLSENDASEPTVFDRFVFDSESVVAYCETDDPRLLAIIQREPLPMAPNYDAQAPTLLGYRYGSHADFTPIGGRSDVPDAWLKARREFGDDAKADRFVSIFYGATAHHVSSIVDNNSWAVVFDAPDWRDDMGIDPAETLSSDGLGSEVTAFINDDVYGVGYAVNEARTTIETPIDISDYNVVIESWGHYGDANAASSALSFDYGRPDITPVRSNP